MFIVDKPFERLPGRSYFVPLVDITIYELGRGEVDVTFKARLDTGADMTCIPKSQAKKLMPLLRARTVLVSAHNGNCEESRTHQLTVSVHGEEVIKSYRPAGGVLLVDCDAGLIGMDIMENWRVTFDGRGKTFSVECL